LKIIPDELNKLVTTAETALDQDKNNVNHWQYRRILKDTLKKLEAIAERGKGA
jgi:hypothetical protein